MLSLAASLPNEKVVVVGLYPNFAPFNTISSVVVLPDVVTSCKVGVVKVLLVFADNSSIRFDKFAVSALFNFKCNASCVAMLMGLLASLVLSTLPKPKLVLASEAVVAPVPPLFISTLPDTLFAVNALNEKGTLTN